MYVCKKCGAAHAYVPLPYGRCECGGMLKWDMFHEAQRPAEEPAATDSLDAHIIELPAEVRPTPRDDGRFVFDSRELIRAGFNRRLQEYDLVRVAGVVFEILGYSYTGRIYVARVFTTEWPDTVPEEWLPKRRRKKKKEES